MLTPVKLLSPKDVSKLSVWLADHQTSLWDPWIARDLETGRLDEVLDQGDAEYEARKANKKRNVSLRSKKRRHHSN